MYEPDEASGNMIFDIETVALDNAAEFLPEPKADARIKDPVKIAANIEEKRTKALGRAALDPDLCRIVAAGWAEGADKAPVVSAIKAESDEAAMLEAFWEEARTSRLICFNGIGFDLPVLLRRSLYLGVKPCIDGGDLNKYRMAKVVDLMQVLSFSGVLDYRSLDFYCKRLGIVVEDEHSGSDIAELFQAEDWDGIVAHCTADITKTAILADHMGYLR